MNICSRTINNRKQKEIKNERENSHKAVTTHI